MKKPAVETNIDPQGGANNPPPVPGATPPEINPYNQAPPSYPPPAYPGAYAWQPPKQTGGFVKFLAAFFLNLNGFGVGYFWMKSTVMAIVELVGTVAILTLTCFFLNADNLILFLLLLLGWWLAHAVIGGFFAAKKEGFAVQPSAGILILIAFGIFVIEGGLFMGLRAIGANSADAGAVAYKAHEFEASAQKYGTASVMYKMTFSKESESTDYYREVSLMVVGIEEAIDEENYDAVPDKVAELIKMEPMLTVTGHDLGLEAAMAKAALQVDDGKYSEAADTYGEAIKSYYRSKNIDDAKEEYYQVMLALGEQLRGEEKYADALDVYTKMSNDLGISSDDAELITAIGQTYLDLSDQLFEAKDYQGALDTLTDYANYQYFDYAFESEMQSRYPDIYLELARQQMTDKDYEAAVTSYEMVIDQYASSSQAKEAKSEIAEAYISYGDEMVASGEDQAALDAYTKALALNISQSDKDRINSAMAGILLNIGNDQIDQQLYMEAEATLKEANKYTASEDVMANIEAAMELALSSLAADTGTQGKQVLADAKQTACNGEAAASGSVNYFKDQAGKALSCSSGTSIPSNLIASTPGEFRYVVSSSTGSSTVQTCTYYLYSGGKAYIKRVTSTQTITVRSADTGRTYSSKTFYGGTPGACPTYHYFSSTTDYIYGSSPSSTEITQWLTAVIK